MGFRLWCCGVVVVAYVISFLIQFGYFAVVYNHLPGQCTRFNMNGSEDMVLYPNNHVLISSGIFFPNSVMHNGEKKMGGIYLMDLNSEAPQPLNLMIEGPGVPTDFSPHGMGHWVGEDGSYYLYVINHQYSGDAVESFQYKPLQKKLIYRKTFHSPLFTNLNDLVVVGMDEFYATMDHYFVNSILKILETYSRVSLGCVVYFDGKTAMVASENLKYPNGIAKSNDGRFVFVNELLVGEIVAYRRSQDNALERVQVLPIQIAVDNIVVDPKTGDMWVALLVHSLKVSGYFKDRSIPVPSKCLHVRLDQKAELPFSNYTIEEVFSSTGDDGVVGAISVCMYAEGRLLAGSIGQDMMLCDVPYQMY